MHAVRRARARAGRAESESRRRSAVDWILIVAATAVFVCLAVISKPPQVDASFGWAAALSVLMFTLMAACGVALWRTTRFR